MVATVVVALLHKLNVPPCIRKSPFKVIVVVVVLNAVWPVPVDTTVKSPLQVIVAAAIDKVAV